MSSNDDKKKFDNINCVCDVVNFINELQDCATNTCPTGCDVPFLGAHHGSKLANTRPFVLYNSEGEPFKIFIPHFPFFSHIFRVESVDDCCAVLRALKVTLSINGCQDETESNLDSVSTFLSNDHVTLEATNSIVTVDLNCFCGIQCLRDVHVAGV